MKDDLPFSLIIPTRECAGWCERFLAEYRRLNIEPIYIVDRRSSDATVQTLEATQASYRFFEPRGNFIEAGTLEFAASVADKNWILRVDDDEFPTQELIRWATHCAAGELDSRAKIYGISRFNLFERNGSIYYGKNYAVFDRNQRSAVLNPQFRLYDKTAIQYKEEVHTPGFVLDDWAYGPPGASLVHFDALLRSAAERIAKIRRYEKAKAGFGWTFASQYLPEIFSLDELSADKFNRDISAFITETPSKDGENVSLTIHEIRQLRTAHQDHSAHAIRSMFESRQDVASRIARSLPEIFVTAPLGEFFCTLSRIFRPTRLEEFVHALGSAIYERASLRPHKARNQNV